MRGNAAPIDTFEVRMKSESRGCGFRVSRESRDVQQESSSIVMITGQEWME